MHFDLSKSGLVEVKVHTKKVPEGIDFTCDTTDIMCINKLIAFNNKYNSNNKFEMDTIDEDCSNLINTVLGKESYRKLFNEPSLNAIELSFNLMEIYQKGIGSVLTAGIKQKAKEIRDTSEEVAKFMKEVGEAEKRHGLSKKRTSPKDKSRKKQISDKN